MSERERFEAWAVNEDGLPVDYISGAAVYANAYTQQAWKAWQAALAERDAALRQVAVLRQKLTALLGLVSTDSAVRIHLVRCDARAALTDTEAAAKEYERELRNRALQEVADKADAEAEKFGVAQSHKTNAAQKSYLQGIARGLEKAAELARAMKETP